MPAGNKPIISSSEELCQKFHNYLLFCEESERFPNIAGFCRFMGISKETYYRYKAEFYSDAIKSIETILEDESIISRSASDAMKIFYLKNKFGYADRYDNSVKIDANVTSRLQTMSDAELETLRSSLHNQLIDSVSS